MKCPICEAPLATKSDKDAEDARRACDRLAEPCRRHAALCWDADYGEHATQLERARWAFDRLKEAKALAHSAPCWIRGGSPCICGLTDLVEALS